MITLNDIYIHIPLVNTPPRKYIFISYLYAYGWYRPPIYPKP